MEPGDMEVVVVAALMILASMDQLAAQASPAAAPVAVKPIGCFLSNASMVSPNYCTYYDQQNMAGETGGCQGYLTDFESFPSADCCSGLNKVAYYRTACICLATFYPPSSVNATRQLALPGLCGVTTDLCGQCPSFLVARTASDPFDTGNRSTASKAGAIVLAVILGAVLLTGIVALSVIAYRRRKAKQNAPPAFDQTAPPGGAF